MTWFEKLYLFSQYSLCFVTGYFYWRLLQNDKKRDQQLERERKKAICKRHFRGCGSSPGMLQLTGKVLSNDIDGEDLELLFEAYEEFFHEPHAASFPSPEKFIEIMVAVDERWNNLKYKAISPLKRHLKNN